VICVGNLTLGGVGKTPVVAALARRLTESGRRPAILSRGYGGSLAGPVQVDPAHHAAGDVGDEPLMLASALPGVAVWVSRDRAAGALAAARGGADVLLMDDGHQNPSVRKTLSLVVCDGETRDGEWPLGDGGVFPSGPLREPLAAGLSRADAVILLMPADLPAPDPELVATLSAGCDLADFAAFPDHAPWTPARLRALESLASAHGAGLVTTSKDWVRLPPDWRGRVTPWPVAVGFDSPADLDALLARLPPG
jgi:tetraacyldisaccharide 4'-kinase